MQFKHEPQPAVPIFDSGNVFIQSFDAEHINDVVSTSRSNISQKSKHLSAMMNSLTVSSYKRIKNMVKSGFALHRNGDDRSGATKLRIKSNTPAIEFESTIFNHWASGWLLKKFDVDSNNNILVNNYHKVSLITYEPNQFNYVFKADLLADIDVFTTSVTFHSIYPDSLLYYYDLKGDRVGLYDYVKGIAIDDIKLRGFQVSALKSVGNLVAVGCNNKVLLYDVRCGGLASDIQIEGDHFNPVTGIEVDDSQILISSKSSVVIANLKKNGGLMRIDQIEGGCTNGIRKAKFYIDDNCRKVVMGLVGTTSLEIHDIDNLSEDPRVIELNKRMLGLDTNTKDGEICVVEGSTKLKLNFYSLKFGKMIDSIELSNDTIDFELNRSKDACVCFSDRKCSIYSFGMTSLDVAENIDIPAYE